MKELTIEEKAQHYDAAINRANSLLSGNQLCNAWIYKVLPELKENEESEDERIRKALIEACKQSLIVGGFHKDKVIAWLEKQGKNNMGISEATKQKLKDNLNKALEKETPESWDKFLDWQGVQKPWSEEDEDILNTIINHFKIDIECTDEDDVIRWLKSLRPQSQWKPSDEQMEGIECTIKTLKYQLNVGDKRLNSLYDDLKKLREE